jgi:hypothetical protein
MLTHAGSVDTEPPRMSVRADVGIRKIWDTATEPWAEGAVLKFAVFRGL